MNKDLRLDGQGLQKVDYIAVISDDGVYLRDVAQRVFSQYSHKYVKQAIREGHLSVNGLRSKTGYRVKAGDYLEIHQVSKTPPRAYDLEVGVRYIDDDVAVVIKPAGLPTSGNMQRTLQHAVIANMTANEDLGWPRILHRLDAPTSGLIMVARSQRGLSHYLQQFSSRRIEKYYRAVVVGYLPQGGVISTPIGRKEAHTRWKVIRRVPGLKQSHYCLVELMPETGRTHQIRRHLAILGHGIVGDAKYGLAGTYPQKGLFLHAHRLHFETPDGEHRTVECTMPPKFDQLLIREERMWKKSLVLDLRE